MSESIKASTLRLDESKIAFIDTMIFLHFQSFDQIDWPSILDTKQVTIIIPPITIRELNKHKDSNALQKIRERAQTIIGKLLDRFKDSNEASVRRGVDIKYVVAEPKINFDAYKLDSNWADDYFLATVISFRTEHPGANVVIVTDDLNLILKSRQYRIDALRLPRELKLPNVLDAYEKQIKELEKTVQELKKQFPVLRLGFEDDSNRVVFSLLKPPEFTNERIEQIIEQLKQEFPKIEVPPPAPVDPNKPKRGVIASELAKDLERDEDGYTIYEKREYNTELDNFFSEYKDYLSKMAQFRDNEAPRSKLRGIGRSRNSSE